jgi:predicted DCC family thiol-disulfide oxidoreductase YuxK
MSQPKSVILFDGVCNLCNSSIDFVLRRDKKDHFRVGALQDEKGKALLAKFDANPEYLDSIVLIEDNKIYFRSTAALRIAKKLPGFWPLLYGLIVLPSVVRDGIYDWIGKNRYRWFGEKSTCRLPTAEERAKFL